MVRTGSQVNRQGSRRMRRATADQNPVSEEKTSRELQPNVVFKGLGSFVTD